MCVDGPAGAGHRSPVAVEETQGGFVISRQVRRSLCALVAVGVVLASCSSDDGDGETTTLAPEPTETPTTDTEAPVDTGLTGDGLAVGVLAPSPGLLTTLFQGQQRGIDFAVEDIADGGGVLGGPLDATTTPAALDGSEADLVPTVVEDGAQALIGPTGSSGAFEYRDAVKNANSISCSASASVPGLTADQETFGLFRTALPDDVTVGYLTEMVLGRRDEQAPGAAWKVAIVARSDDYGLAIGNGLAYALDSHGLVPTVVDYNAHRVNFTGTASEVTDLAPDLTVIVSYEEGAPIVTELVRGGVDPAAMIGLESFFRPRIATLAAPDGKAELVDGFTMVGTTGDRAFLERLYEADPNGQIANAAQAYDCTMVLALANEAVADGASDSVSAAVIDVTADGTTCTTYEDCLTKLQAGENIDYDGASGRIGIDEHGDPTFGRFTTATIQDGEVGNIETSDVDVAALRQEQAAFAAAAFNTKLQQALTFLGFYDGPIDGLESPELTAALAAFQASVGLPPTGVYDAATDAALRAALGEFSDLFNESTARSADPAHRPRLLQRPDRRNLVARVDRGRPGLAARARRSRDRRDRRGDRAGHLRAASPPDPRRPFQPSPSHHRRTGDDCGASADHGGTDHRRTHDGTGHDGRRLRHLRPPSRQPPAPTQEPVRDASSRPGDLHDFFELLVKSSGSSAKSSGQAIHRVRADRRWHSTQTDQLAALIALGPDEL